MLFITNDYDKVYIKDVETYFNSIVDKSIFDKDIYRNIIRAIDNAKYLGNDIIETPLGKTLINNLSTGCKTVILIVFLLGKKDYIPITECGENALEYILDLSNKHDIYVFTNYGFILNNNKKIKCIMNGQKINNVFDLYHMLEG